METRMMQDCISDKERIQKIIDEIINPKLSTHMGGMELKDFQEGILTVRFTGACGSCYAAEETLDNFVKAVFAREMPEIREVLLDNSVSDDLLELTRSLMSGGAGRS